MREDSVKEKRVRQVFEVAAPFLAPGEHVQIATIADVGTVSVARKAVFALVVGIVSLGTMIGNVKPRRLYIAVTERWLLFFEGNTPSGRPGRELLMRLDKRQLTASEPKEGLMTLSTLLSIGGQPNALKVKFPRPCREDARRLLAGLTRTVRLQSPHPGAGLGPGPGPGFSDRRYGARPGGQEYGAGLDGRRYGPGPGGRPYGPGPGDRQYGPRLGDGQYGPVSGDRRYGAGNGERRYGPAPDSGLRDRRYGAGPGGGQYGPGPEDRRYGPVPGDRQYRPGPGAGHGERQYGDDRYGAGPGDRRQG